MRASDASLSGFDRRECHRAHFYADVEIEWEEQTLCYRTSDFSLDGIMVETDRPLLAGTQFRPRVMLEEPPPPLEVSCAVRQVVDGAGMGLAFTELAPADHARLRKLLARLPH